MTKSPPQVNAPDVVATLQVFTDPGQVVELRGLNVRRQYGRPVTMNGYFDGATKLAQAAVGLNGAPGGLYFTANPINPDLLARRANRIETAGNGECSTDKDVLERRWLLIDLDPIRPSGISSTDQEHQAAIQRARDIRAFLTTQSWPEPVLASSGNGAHLIYRVELPRDDDGLCEQVLAALADRFDDGAVKVDKQTHNPGRLLKLYGTYARKGDDMPDRPHRITNIIDHPENVVAVPEAALRTVAELAPTQPPSPTRQTKVHERGRFDLDEWISTHRLDVIGPTEWQGGRRWVFRICPWNAEHTNRSAFIGQLAGGGIAAGCHHDGCNGLGWHDLRDTFEPGWRDKQNRKPIQSNRKTSPEVEPFQPFPVEALPEPVKSFVVKGAAAIGCDQSYVALPLLAALASAIGNTRRIQLKRGWPEPAILWVVIVGESGTQKSPAFRLAVQFTRQRQDESMKAHRVELEAYEIEVQRYEKELAEWKRSKAVDGDPPTKPKPPQAQRFLVSDVTVEGLAPILSANPRGVLLARDELAGWVGSFDRYAAGKGGADESHWLSMHSGETLIVDRKTGHQRTIYVPSAAVSIAGGIQPGILDRIMGLEHRESGLLARLLLVMPPRNPRRWTEAEVPASTEAAVAGVFKRLYELSFDGTDEDPKPRVLEITADGKVAWIDFYNEHGGEQNRLTGDLAAAWSKLEGYAARLALVVHFIRWAADDPTLSNLDAVDAESVAAGVAFSRWFGKEARRLYAAMGESAEDQDRRRLAEWIRGRGGSVSSRNLTHGLRRFRGATKEAESALDDLVEEGWGRWMYPEPAKTGGRPTRRFQLASVTETSDQDSASGGFGYGDTVDSSQAESFDGPDSGGSSGDEDDWGAV